MGIVPAVGLAQGTAPAAAVPAGTGLARGTGRAGVPAGTVRVEVPGIVPARGIDRAGAVLSAPGTGRAGVLAGTGLARGIGRPWVGRGTGPGGIGRLGVGPSCGC